MLVDVARYSCVCEACVSPALTGSSAIYGTQNVKICSRIISAFYMGLLQISLLAQIFYILCQFLMKVSVNQVCKVHTV